MMILSGQYADNNMVVQKAIMKYNRYNGQSATKSLSP